MTILYRNSNRQAIKLVKEIANSGEGRVYKTDLNGYLAKIYHQQDWKRVEKLKVMLANPPADPMAAHNHKSIAFPADLLQDRYGNVLGFLMPYIQNNFDLYTVCNAKLRKKKAPDFNWMYLHVTAERITLVIQKIHAQHYVLGDIKLQNILVNNKALVTIIDTDSFQVIDSKKRELYPCQVGSEGFTPPELFGQDFAKTTQTEIHDRFRLGVLIHYLLFGCHPFTGKWHGAGDSPDPNELVRRGLWYGGRSSSIGPSRYTIPLDVVHPALKQCFLRCFNDGHSNPHLRPTPQEWLKALQVARADLKACKKVNNHYYSQTYGKCYWCERAIALSDPFPDTSGKKAPNPQPNNHQGQSGNNVTTGLYASLNYLSNQPQKNTQTVLQTQHNNAYLIIQYLRKNWKFYVGSLAIIFCSWTFINTLHHSKLSSNPPRKPVPISNKISFLNGTWKGSYTTCDKRLVRMYLYIEARSETDIDAYFLFTAHPKNLNVRTGNFKMNGTLTKFNSSRKSKIIDLKATEWLTRPRRTFGLELMDLHGKISKSRQKISGDISSKSSRSTSCNAVFEVTRLTEQESNKNFVPGK
jgi:serine/threonine protein kinase